MTATEFILICGAGGAGAVSRFALECAFAQRERPGPLPVIVVINVIGAALLGIVSVRLEPGTAHTVIAIGYLGAFTTFSTWMVQLLAQLRERSTLGIMVQLSPMILGPLAYIAARIMAAP